MKEHDCFRAKSGVCYISEAGKKYTYEDYITIAKGNTTLAQILFDLSSWQHPETIFDELFRNGEIDENGNIIYED